MLRREDERAFLGPLHKNVSIDTLKNPSHR